MKIYKQQRFSEVRKAEWFFRTFCPGNTPGFVDRPFERFSDYETLLKRLQESDSEKYQSMHKGTPFYFLAWTAFDLRNYEKGLFYADAALSEDFRSAPDKWLNNPAAQIFLKLDKPQEEVAERVIEKIRKALNREIGYYNTSGCQQGKLDSSNFISDFVEPLIKSAPEMRTIVTALYTFLLEFDDRYNELKIRSIIGGSIEPFIIHLFKGALIFESLLKHTYLGLKGNRQTPAETLGHFLRSPEFKSDFKVNKIDTSSKSLEHIVEIAKGSVIKSAFETTAKLRNTTGHNFVWSDIFLDPDNYQNLYRQEIKALFHLIEKKFVTTLHIAVHPNIDSNAFDPVVPVKETTTTSVTMVTTVASPNTPVTVTRLPQDQLK